MAAAVAEAPGPMRLALVGSPNSGKTTLFNALTGLRQTVANYSGVTVEHAIGTFEFEGGSVELIDLPGTYSLQALSPDEQVTIDVIDGKRPEVAKPEGVVIVADATTLRRSLQLVGEVMAHGLPTVLILTMIDEMKARNGAVKVPKLSRELGIPVVGVVGNRGVGLDDVRALLTRPTTWLQDDHDVPANVEERFAWADEIYEKSVTTPTDRDPRTDALDKVVLHPVFGILIFVAVMFAFFQVVFTVAAPLQEAFEGGILALGTFLQDYLPESMFTSLLVDGVIGGVGGVVVFVPQIALLLLMIALLEGSGFMARAAFVIDRAMGWAGLEGRSFIALL
jgi:ferrous iron transport protein B